LEEKKEGRNREIIEEKESGEWSADLWISDILSPL
jgi:hypothetical protein